MGNLTVCGYIYFEKWFKMSAGSSDDFTISKSPLRDINSKLLGTIDLTALDSVVWREDNTICWINLHLDQVVKSVDNAI